MRELKANVKEWKGRALKNDESLKRQTEKQHRKMRKLQDTNKALSKGVEQLTRERDELACELASKNTQLSIKDNQIVVKREKIDEQSQDLADLRRKSTKIGDLLR